ncbi:MAG TPA: phosphatase PAP2 family protein [Ignavibacteria bacterium]|nr:phosphatase PAP2 family protein [Ignavibacteria bacterium]
MKYFKDLYTSHKYFFNSVLSIFILLVLILNLFDLQFSGSKTSDRLAPVWLFITAGGGVYGIAVSFLIFAFYVLFQTKKNHLNKRTVLFFLIIVFLVQLINAGSTYFIFKGSYNKMRPSQHFITGTEDPDKGEILFYEKLSKDKKKFLREKTLSEPERFLDIYPPLLSDWVNESENSFPSGHSQSSFFIAVIFAFAISCLVKKNKIYLSVIPLLWALLVSVSRVIIGVHYNIDVIAGAGMGISTALILISIKRFNRIFIVDEKQLS